MISNFHTFILSLIAICRNAVECQMYAFAWHRMVCKWSFRDFNVRWAVSLSGFANMSTKFTAKREFRSQGQYWAGRTPRPNNGPSNMATANFVVINNGEGCALNGTAVAAVLSTNSVPRAFFPRVAIACRLSLKIDRNLSPFWAGTLSVATWYE